MSSDLIINSHSLEQSVERDITNVLVLIQKETAQNIHCQNTQTAGKVMKIS